MDSSAVFSKLLKTLGFLVKHRYFMVFLVICSILGTVLSNACINIALQAMTPDKSIHNKTLPANERSSIPLRDRVFDWNQSTQSLIFGLFFISNNIFKTPAGYFIQRFGGKWFITVCLLGSSFISSVTPISTDYIALLLTLRLVIGLIQSGCYPAAYNIISRWIPLEERSLCFSFMQVAPHLASITCFLASGAINAKYGWPSLFYMPAIISGLIGLTTLFFLQSKPPPSPTTETFQMAKNESQQEIVGSEVKSDLSNESKESVSREYNEKNLKTPFMQILTNKSVLAFTLFQFTSFFTQFLISSKVPTYLKDVQRQDLTSNGYTNAIMSVVAATSHLMNGTLCDFIMNRKWLTRTQTRKLFGCLSGFVSSICLMSIPIAGDCHSKLFILHILLFGCSVGEGFGGNLIAIPSEMTTHFSAVTFAFISMIASTSGFLAPSYAGMILDKVHNQWNAWCIIFWSTGSLLFVATIIFVLFASAERQAFDKIEDNDDSETIEKEDYIKSKC